MSWHLGPWAAALVDEQLPAFERSRALRHLAACDRCRFEVDQQRAVKARLDELSAPALPNALLDRLQSMRPIAPPTGPSGTGLTGPMVSASPVQPASPMSSASPVQPASPLQASASATGGRRARRALVGAASLVLIGGGVAYVAGGNGSGSSAPPVRPAVDLYTVQHGTTSGTVPLHDPASSAVTVGFGR